MASLYLDVGNTSISFALRDRGRWSPIARAASRPEPGEAWEGELAEAAAKAEAAVAASVNPAALDRLERWLRERHPRLPLFCAGRDFRIAVTVLARAPGEVGIDRLLNAVAAFSRAGRACLVIDLGTATTFDLVSAEGAYLGGAIAPGISLCFKALYENTALLPRMTPREPAEPVGRDTESCLSIGVIEGYRGLVSHLAARFRRELGPDAPVLLTGGEAAWVAKAVPGSVLAGDLTLDGLRIAYERSVEELLPTRRGTRSA